MIGLRFAQRPSQRELPLVIEVLAREAKEGVFVDRRMQLRHRHIRERRAEIDAPNTGAKLIMQWLERPCHQDDTPRSAWQAARAHQILVDSARTLTAFVDRPDDE